MDRRTIGVFFKVKMGRREMMKVMERIIIFIGVVIMLRIYAAKCDIINWEVGEIGRRAGRICPDGYIY